MPQLMLDNKQTQIWLLLTCPEESTYTGNLGYDDQTSEKYLYDSSVPNHLQLKEGDLAVLRDKKNLLGLARIERIEKSEGKKRRFRCPSCSKTTNIVPRKNMKPKYRCVKCGETFDIPNSQDEDCYKFTAYFGNSFISAEGAVSIKVLKDSCIRKSKQNAMQLLDSELIKPILLEKAPQLRGLLFTDYLLDDIKADDAEDENSKNKPELLYDSIIKDYHKILFQQIRARRGQSQFRNALRECYGNTCMVTGCQLMDIIEAAHILPYCNSENNHPENGLLLRTDLHTLFDLDLFGIDPESLKITFHPIAITAGYQTWEGKTLACLNMKPNKAALEFRWIRFGERKNRDPL